MTRHLFGTVGSVAALTILVGGCVTDPTSDLRGPVELVTLNRSHVELTAGDSVKVEAQSWDRQGNVTADLPTVTSSDPSVIAVRADSFQTGDPLPRTIVWAVAITDGTAFLTAEASGVESDSTLAYVYPAALDGVVTATTSGQVTILTIGTTPNITFDTTESEVLIGDQEANVISRTQQQLVAWFAPDHSKAGDIITVTDLWLLNTRPMSDVEMTTTLDVTEAVFTGTVTTDATGAADVYTLTAPTTEKFNPTSSQVTVGGQATFIISRTADQMVVGLFGALDTTDVAVNISNVMWADSSYNIGTVTATTTVDARAAFFTGTIAAAASGQGYDIITVNATADLTFNTATTTATIGGTTAFVHAVTANQLQLVSSNPSAATDQQIVLRNIVYDGAYPVATLTADDSVDVSAFVNFMTDDIATAPDITAGPFPLTFYGVVSPSSIDQIVKVAPAADLTLSTSVRWILTATDIDVFYTDAVDDFVDCLGCGVSNPETGTGWTITGGDTNHFYVELYSGVATMFQVRMTSP